MKIFKYLHPDRIDILKNQAIRFTQPMFLNDRFEFKLDFSQMISPEKYENLIDYYLEESNANDEFQKSISETLNEVISQINDPAVALIFQSLKNENIDTWKNTIKDSLTLIKPLFIQISNSSSGAFK